MLISSYYQPYSTIYFPTSIIHTHKIHKMMIDSDHNMLNPIYIILKVFIINLN
jgi:hypothetical protein